MDERGAEVVDRALDEGRRPEDGGVDLHARQPWLHLLDCRLDAGSDVERVGPWQLLDDEHQALAAIDDCVTEQRLVIDQHVCDIAQDDYCAVVVDRDRHFGQFVRTSDGKSVLDVQTLGRRLDPPSRTDEPTGGEPQQPRVQRVGRGIHHLVERDVVRLHALGIYLYLKHLDPLTPDWHVGHAGHSEQPGSHLPVGDHRHVDRRQASPTTGQSS